MKPHTQTEFIYECRGEQIRVRINSGPEKQIPLLICSGFGIALETMDSIVAAMPGTTVIRFDPPGIGRSSKRLLPYRFSHLVNVLVDLLESLGFPQVDIYGISWGGMLAQEFALACPQRCRKLILASTLPGIVSVPGNLLLHALLSPGKWFLGREYSRTASLIYGGEVRQDDWSDLEEHLAVYHTALTGYLGQVSALISWTSIHRLHKLSQPVLLLYGSDDSAIPMVNAQILKKIIPDSHLVKLDCGHLFPWTRSAQVHREISKFRSEDNGHPEKNHRFSKKAESSRSS